jgi:hypothetical protein
MKNLNFPLLFWGKASIIYLKNFCLGLWLKVEASRRRNDPRKELKMSFEHGAA